jgi:thiamine-phosphate pyrophosphorylase
MTGPIMVPIGGPIAVPTRGPATGPTAGTVVRPALGRLHVVTDTRDGRDALAMVRAIAAAGAPVVQIRAKGCTDLELFDFAGRVRAICAPYATTCVVNDRVDVALAVRAHGTHLGAMDLPLDAVRRIAGAGHLIGGTAREPGRAVDLIAAGADYLGVGPAYPTGTKEGLPDPLGPGGVAAVARSVTAPVIAIGGITVDRVGEMMAAGAYGVAVIAAISTARDPGEATRAFLRALDAQP